MPTKRPSKIFPLLSAPWGARRVFILLGLVFLMGATPSRALEPLPDENVAPVLELSKSLSEQGTQIQFQTNQLFRRALYPNSAGTDGGIPSSFDLDLLENEFTAYLRQVETLLARPDFHLLEFDSLEKGRKLINDFFKDSKTPEEAKDSLADQIPSLTQRVIGLHMDIATKIVRIRMAMGLPYNQEIIKRFSLTVPESLLSSYTQMQDAFEGPFSQTYLTLASKKEGKKIRLLLSHSFIQGLEVGALRDKGGDRAFLSMIRYLTVHQLMQDLAVVQTLKKDHRVSHPPIPQKLLLDFKSMGDPKAILSELSLKTSEPALRNALADTGDILKGQLPTLSSDDYVEIFVSQLERDPQTPPEALKTLVASRLEDAEKEKFLDYLKAEIDANQILFSTLDDSILPKALAQVVSLTLAESHLRTFARLKSKGLAVKPGGVANILHLVDAKRLQIEKKISLDLMKQWARKAQGSALDQVYVKRRKNFIKHLLENAKKISDAFNNPDSDIDLSILQGTLATKAAKAQISDEAKQWMTSVTRINDWNYARKRYSQMMAQLTYAGVLDGGVVNPAKAKVYIETHDFESDAQLPKDELDQEFSEYMASAIGKKNRKALKDFLTLGHWMGFHRTDIGSLPIIESPSRVSLDAKDGDDIPFLSLPEKTILPKLKDIIGNKDDQKLYGTTLRNYIEENFPILGDAIERPNPEAGKPGKLVCMHGDCFPEPQPEFIRVPLYEAIASEKDPQVIDRSVEEAIQIRENRIRENIQKVGASMSTQEIRHITGESLILQTILNSFPEFRLNRQELLKEILEPDLFEQIMNRYTMPYMAAGFGSMILLKSSRWIAGKTVSRAMPFFDVGIRALQPFVKGYMTALTTILAADTVHLYMKMQDKKREKQYAESLFGSTVTESYYRITDLRNIQSEYKMSQVWFYSAAVMDATAVMGVIPTALRVIRWNLRGAVPLQELRPILENLNDFQRLGFRNVTWSKKEILKKTEEMAKQAQTARDLQEIHEASHRLVSTIDSGRTWNTSQLRKYDIRLDDIAPEVLAVEKQIVEMTKWVRKK